MSLTCPSRAPSFQEFYSTFALRITSIVKYMLQMTPFVSSGRAFNLCARLSHRAFCPHRVRWQGLKGTAGGPCRFPSSIS